MYLNSYPLVEVKNEEEVTEQRKSSSRSFCDRAETPNSARRRCDTRRGDILSALFNDDGVGVRRYRGGGFWNPRVCPSRDARLSRREHEFRQRLGRSESGVGDFQREFNGEPFEDGFGRVRVRVVGGWRVYDVHAVAEAVANEGKKHVVFRDDGFGARYRRVDA